MPKFVSVLLALLGILGLGYFAFEKFRFEKREPVEPFVITDLVTESGAGAGDMEEGGNERAEEIGIVPEVRIAEFPGKRLVLLGKMSTVDGRAAVVEAIKADLGDAFVIDDQINLDYQCAPFSWSSKLADLDFTEVQKVRQFALILTNTQVSLSGEVFSEEAGRNVARRIESALPEGVSLDDQLKSVAKPEASFSVWAAPDRTILLSGTVPAGGSESYVKVVQNAMPGMPVINDLIEDRFVVTPAWQEQIQGFLPGFLRSTQRASLKIDEGNKVRLEGLAQSATLASMRQKLAASFPTPKYQVEINLQLGVPTDIEVAKLDEAKGQTAPVARSVAEMIGTFKIYFRSGRSRASELTSTEREKLDRLGRQWRQENFNQKVYVFGFTDKSGDPDTNAYFSKNRCENVVAYLTKDYNIDRSFFEVIGTPENFPEESGTANELRRVEFSLTNQPSQAPVMNWVATTSGPTNVLKPVVAEDLFAKSKQILFGSGKISPSKEDRDSLFQLGSALALEKNQDMIIIYGYGDSAGKREANEWYTEERCKAVQKELVRGGVSQDRIVIRTILPAKVTKKSEDAEEPKEESNPRRVELVMMSRADFDKAEAEAAAQRQAEAAAEAEAEAAKVNEEPKSDEDDADADLAPNDDTTAAGAVDL